MDNASLDKLSKPILSDSIEVHKQLGPGLLESVYKICLYKELISSGLHVQRQVFLPVTYQNDILELDFRIDLLVNSELKAVDTILPVHEAQLITCLKLAEKKTWLPY